MATVKVCQLPSGLLVASQVIWDGEGWREIPSAPACGVSPLFSLVHAIEMAAAIKKAQQAQAAAWEAMKEHATLYGFPIVFREPGYRGASFEKLFYGSYSEN